MKNTSIDLEQDYILKYQLRTNGTRNITINHQDFVHGNIWVVAAPPKERRPLIYNGRRNFSKTDRDPIWLCGGLVCI